MRLHFIGTGGGHKTTGKQLRKTAGIIIEGYEASIYLDPGPGSLVHSQSYSTEDLKGVIVSHSHLDHYSDAEPIIEKISLIHENSCKLMASESVLHGYSDIQKSISDYHQNMCTEIVDLTEEDTELKNLKIKSQEMFHSDPKTRGLKISDGEEKIGFWTDTAFSEELLNFYSECDTIVINCLFPRGVDSRKHTTIEDIPKILENLEASTAILTHFSERMIKSDMDEEKAWLEDQVDQKVIFADDGMSFPGDRKLSSFQS